MCGSCCRRELGRVVLAVEERTCGSCCRRELGRVVLAVEGSCDVWFLI